MAQGKYIKVTPKGETTPRIISAALRTFYISQGAKIEEPTEEEIAAEFPDEKEAAQRKAQAAAASIALKKENEELREKVQAGETRIAELTKSIEEKDAIIADKDTAISELKEQLAAAKKEAEKANKKANKK